MRYLVWVYSGRKFSERDFDRMQALINKFCEQFCPYRNKMGCSECPSNIAFDEAARLLDPDVKIVARRVREGGS